MNIKDHVEIQDSTNLNDKNILPTFKEEDSAELSELLRAISKGSIYGSDEYKRLLLQTTELMDKFGGADKILDQLDKQLRYAK